MKWVGHITRIGKAINAYKILFGKSDGKMPMADLDIDEKLIL
jgi:hypothetical protein